MKVRHLNTIRDTMLKKTCYQLTWFEGRNISSFIGHRSADARKWHLQTTNYIHALLHMEVYRRQFTSVFKGGDVRGQFPGATLSHAVPLSHFRSLVPTPNKKQHFACPRSANTSTLTIFINLL